MGAALVGSRIGDLTIDGGVEGTTETQFCSLAAGAGNPGADKLFIIRSIADIRNDSGANQTVRERWKYGPTPTVFFDYTTIALADAGATNRYADITNIFLAGENSVTAQRAMMEHRLSGQTPAGGYSGGNDQANSVKSAAVDSSSDYNIVGTAQLSAANSELEYRNRGVWLELAAMGLDSGAGGSRMVAKDATQFIYANSTALTTVGTLTIPGGTLSTGNLLIVKVYMDAINTSGAAAQWWADIVWGSTTIFDALTGVAQPSHADRKAFSMEFWIGGHGATNDQVCAMLGHGIGGDASSGTGVLAAAGGQANNSYSNAAEDSTANRTITLKTQMNVASANVGIRYNGMTAKVLKAA